MTRKALMQASADRGPARGWARIENSAKGTLDLARIAFPCFDEPAVLRAERVCGTATLHGRLGLGHPLVKRRHCRGGGWRGPIEDRAMPGELAGLERHRLLRPVEHRGELQICRQLAV